MPVLNRRDWMKASALGGALAGWMPALADSLAKNKSPRKHCILLWMTGGPSQMDTFDLKPDHENGGEFKPIATASPGLQISEHLPRLAKLSEHFAVVRGLSTKEGDHGRGTYLMRTGHQPGGPIRYPTLGSLMAKQLGRDDAELPNFISVGPYRIFNQAAFQPGFLGPKYAALTVGASDSFNFPQPSRANGGYAELRVDDLQAPGSVSAGQVDNRLALLKSLQEEFVSQHQTDAPLSHKTVYERAVKMMKSKAAQAFDLSREPGKVRDRYGKGRFGQGCLMARRLIEQGVPFVECTLFERTATGFGWDTHQNNFRTVKDLSAILDAGWSSLMADLKDRGLLKDTTIIWMGEFGRTPKIQRRPGGGRDHYPKAWSAVLAGGGIKGGQAFGRTSKDGTTVEEGKVDVGDLLATLCKALKVDPRKQNISEMGRPIRIAEGKPIEPILA
jgi:Protein of unknown function (DUF1501)